MRLKCTYLIIAFILTTQAWGKTVAIIESSHRYLKIKTVNHLTITETVRMQILDKEGYKLAVYYDYYNSFRKIKRIQYTIYDSSNKKVKKLTKADAHDVMFNATYEVGDVRTIILDPEYQNFPFTVEYEVEIEYNGYLSFPDWIPQFAPDLEVREATMTLECYSDFKFKNLELNGVPPPLVTNTPEIKSYKWSVQNLNAVEKHKTSKSFYADQPKVYVTPLYFILEGTNGTFTSWKGFGDWYLTLNAGRDSLSNETKKDLDGLVKQHKGDVNSLAKAVYQYMQSKTRYISIQLGIGGYQAIPAHVVDKNGYGDCKALSNYMKAMLNYVKILSNSVLVYAGRDTPDIRNDFPSNQFNHIFLAVPSATDTLWFECTSQTTPPDYIGKFTDDRFVLWLDKNKSQMIRTPAYTADQSVKSTSCIVNLSKDGNANLELDIKQTGLYFDESGFYLNISKDRTEKYNYAKFNFKDFSIQSFNYTIPDRNQALLNLSYQLKVNGLGKSVGTKMVVPLGILGQLENEDEIDIDAVNKKGEIRRSFTIDDRIEIQLPENFRALAIPENLKEESEFGTVTMEISADNNNILHVRKTAVIKKGNYKGADFERLQETIKRIRTLEQSKIILQSKT
jgi:hypothetical protein